MTDRSITRRDWMTGVASTLAATGISACGQAPAPVSLSTGRTPPDRPNIVVFLADTLRADHLGCYGYPHRTSPFLDSFAESGVLFEQYISGSTWTKPALGTMLTGVPARVHQAVVDTVNGRSEESRNNPRVQVLKTEFVTLAETLSGLGYSTAYIQVNTHGRPTTGCEQGFDFIRYRRGYPLKEQITDALDWIEGQAKEPYFLFLHEIDPHAPYRPTEGSFFDVHGLSTDEARQDLDPEEGDRIQRFLKFYGRPELRPELGDLSPEGLNHYRMLYDGEIYDVDGQFRRLVNTLKRKGHFERTVVVFTSDHGEGFQEHGFKGHGVPLPYDELLHVPLVMAGGFLPQGVRIRETCSMLDFYPTLVELAGGEPPTYVSNTPLITRSGAPSKSTGRIAFSDLDGKRSDTAEWDAVITTDRYKVATHREKGTHRIFDRVDDPLEQHNLYRSGALSRAVEEDLLAKLHEQLDRYDKLRQQFGEAEWIDTTDASREALQALGYI